MTAVAKRVGWTSGPRVWDIFSEIDDRDDVTTLVLPRQMFQHDGAIYNAHNPGPSYGSLVHYNGMDFVIRGLTLDLSGNGKPGRIYDDSPKVQHMASSAAAVRLMPREKYVGKVKDKPDFTTTHQYRGVLIRCKDDNREFVGGKTYRLVPDMSSVNAIAHRQEARMRSTSVEKYGRWASAQIKSQELPPKAVLSSVELLGNDAVKYCAHASLNCYKDAASTRIGFLVFVSNESARYGPDRQTQPTSAVVGFVGERHPSGELVVTNLVRFPNFATADLALKKWAESGKVPKSKNIVEAE